MQTPVFETMEKTSIRKAGDLPALWVALPELEKDRRVAVAKPGPT